MITEFLHFSGSHAFHAHPSALTWFSVLFLGFFLGMRHATDADHVVAVTNFVTRQRSMRAAVSIGAVWGLGHTLAIVAAGGAIVCFGLIIPPRVGLSLEFGVALMLILIGLLNVDGFVRWMRAHVRFQAVATASPGPGFAQMSAASRESLPSWLETRAVSCPGLIRPLAVGLVHGLAGSAALSLLVLPMIQNPGWAMGYLLMFGLGSIAGMATITAVIAWPCVHFSGAFSHLTRRISTAAGYCGIAFGMFLVYEIGFVEGLFLH